MNFARHHHFAIRFNPSNLLDLYAFLDNTLGSDTRNKVLGLLSNCRLRAFSEIVKETRLGKKAVEGILYKLWKEKF